MTELRCNDRWSGVRCGLQCGHRPPHIAHQDGSLLIWPGRIEPTYVLLRPERGKVADG